MTLMDINILLNILEAYLQYFRRLFVEKESFFISTKTNKIKIGKIIKNNFFNSIYSLIIINSLFDFRCIMVKQKDKIYK